MSKTIKIRKGWHRPLRLIPACFRNFGITRTEKQYMDCHTIKFNPDCAYHIDGADQWDWSKLFGFCFGITGIHRNSVRFGWRYNPNTAKIEISRLLYFGNHQHVMDYLCSLDINTEHDFCIVHEISGDSLNLTFYVDDRKWEYTVPRPSCRLRFGCGFYFGGNQTAPQDVSIVVD